MELHFDHSSLVGLVAVEAVARNSEHLHDRTVVVLGSLRPDSLPENLVVDPADHAGLADPAGSGAFAFAARVDTSHTGHLGRLDPVVETRVCAADRVVVGDIGFADQLACTRGCSVGLAVGRKAFAAVPVEEDIGAAGPEGDIDRSQSFVTAIHMGHSADHRLAWRDWKRRTDLAEGSYIVAGHERHGAGFGAIVEVELIREAYTARWLARTDFDLVARVACKLLAVLVLSNHHSQVFAQSTSIQSCYSDSTIG